MGRISRKRSDKTFNGSKLVVPGQGISTSKVDKNSIKTNDSNKPNKKK